MRVKLLTVVIGLSLALLGSACRQIEKPVTAPEADFFVSLNGNDSWSGKLAEPNASRTDGPFKSLLRAREAVREKVRQGLTAHVLVLLRGGTYELPEPLWLTVADSGTDVHSITYAAFQDEIPVISGGRAIAGWKKQAGSVWTAEVPAVKEGWWFRQVIGQDRRLVRARYPNAGQYLKVQETGKAKGVRAGAIDAELATVTVDGPFPGDNLASQEAELVVYHLFSLSRGRIMSTSGPTVSLYNQMGWVGLPFVQTNPGDRAHLEHALPFLDAPGEWYLDRDRATLYYFAADNEDPNRMTFVAPHIPQLLVLAGTKDSPIRNVHFRGIRFEHSTWDLPLAGYTGIQAGHYGSRYIDQATYALTPAIQCTYLRNCSFEECRFAHFGASGLAFGAGAVGNRVTGCEFYDIGGNAVMVGWRPSATAPPRRFFDTDWADLTDAPLDNEISHNTIRECAAEQFDCVGIFVAYSTRTVIAHNLVHDLPYTGISIGLTWNDFPTTQKACRVEYNHVHDVMKVLHDGAGIYTLGYQPGTRITHNLVHDVPGGHGMYTDEGSSQILIENNIFYRLGVAGWNHHYGQLNTIRNNIFALPKKCGVRRTGRDEETSFTCEGNIFLLENAVALDGDRANDLFVIDRNLYWLAGAPGPLQFARVPLEKWQSRGHDRQSLVADPGFADAANGNFTLPADSPAFKIGFRPIDLSQVGPHPNR